MTEPQALTQASTSELISTNVSNDSRKKISMLNSPREPTDAELEMPFLSNALKHGRLTKPVIKRRKRTWLESHILTVDACLKVLLMVSLAVVSALCSLQYYTYNDPVQIWLSPEVETSFTSSILLAQTVFAGSIVLLLLFTFCDTKLTFRPGMAFIAIILIAAIFSEAATILTTYIVRSELINNIVPDVLKSMSGNTTHGACDHRMLEIQHSFECCGMSGYPVTDYKCDFAAQQRKCVESPSQSVPCCDHLAPLHQTLDQLTITQEKRSSNLELERVLNVYCYNASYYRHCHPRVFPLTMISDIQTDKGCLEAISEKIRAQILSLTMVSSLAILIEMGACFTLWTAYHSAELRDPSLELADEGSSQAGMPDIFSPDLAVWIMLALPKLGANPEPETPDS